MTGETLLPLSYYISGGRGVSDNMNMVDVLHMQLHVHVMIADGVCLCETQDQEQHTLEKL